MMSVVAIIISIDIAIVIISIPVFNSATNTRSIMTGAASRPESKIQENIRMLYDTLALCVQMWLTKCHMSKTLGIAIREYSQRPLGHEGANPTG